MNFCHCCNALYHCCNCKKKTSGREWKLEQKSVAFRRWFNMFVTRKILNELSNIHKNKTSSWTLPHCDHFVITCSVIGLKWMTLLVLLFFTIDDGMSNTSETDVLNFHTKLMSLGMPSTSQCICAVSPRPTLYVWTCPGRQIGATVRLEGGEHCKINSEFNQAKSIFGFSINSTHIESPTALDCFLLHLPSCWRYKCTDPSAIS
jgi:hypothetical protein